MYTIYSDEYLLHSDIPGYQLLNAKLIMEVNQPGSLEFEILPDHPALFSLSKLKSEILVMKNGSPYWKGRIVDDTKAMDKRRKIYCEGKLKSLMDTVIRPRIFDGSANQVFHSYLDEHNRQVSAHQKILPGTVSITGDVYRDLKNYEFTYERIKDLVTSLGGYLFVRYEADGDYLDWVEEFTDLSEQEISLGKNILNLTDELSSEKLYTYCIPRGAKLLDENGAETGSRLTVESIKGVDYVFDEEKVNEYGWICAPVPETTWDEIETAAGLLARAITYLDTKKGLVQTLSITALDLSLAGQDLDSFNFCERIKVNSQAHGIIEEYLLSKIEVDITNPANTKITLGQSTMTLTDQNKEDREKIVFTVNDLVTALTGTNQGLAGEVAARQMYIRYQGGVIEMGEVGSDLKMRLSNTELSFWETLGGAETKVAYIANPTGNPGDSKLYIENGEIVQTLDLGDFRFIKRDNGNLSLVFKG